MVFDTLFCAASKLTSNSNFLIHFSPPMKVFSHQCRKSRPVLVDWCLGRFASPRAKAKEGDEEQTNQTRGGQCGGLCAQASFSATPQRT